MSSRELDDWIKGFMFYTGESEAPDSYLYWTALNILSSVTLRHIWIEWAYYKVYPNLYIMLVGPAGNRKNASIRFANDLLRAVKVPIASSSVSREALGDQMKSRGGDTQAISIVNNEFASFVRTSGDSMIEFLTDIFDCPSNFEHSTRGSGVVKIEKPFLTLLAGAVPDWIANTFDVTFVESGFASRTIFINENTVRFRNPRPEVTREMRFVRDKLIRDLEHIMTLKGEFQWGEGAGQWFDEWYVGDYDKEKLSHKLQGFKARKPLHILKTAMLMSLNESDELIVRKKHLLEALAQIEKIQPKMEQAFSAVGRNPFASNLERIAFEIKTREGMSKGAIIETMYHDIPNKQILEEILENLELMGKIRRARKENEIWYYPTS